LASSKKSNGNKLTRYTNITYTSKGEVEKKHLNKYNKYGDIILKQSFDADGKEEDYNYMRYEYEYDEKENWIQKIEFLKNGNSLDVVKRKIEFSSK